MPVISKSWLSFRRCKQLKSVVAKAGKSLQHWTHAELRHVVLFTPVWTCIFPCTVYTAPNYRRKENQPCSVCSSLEQRGFVNVCVHYVCRDVFSLSERPCLLNGKETDCLCTRYKVYTVHIFVYFTVWKGGRVRNGEGGQETEATAAPQVSVVFDAGPQSNVPHLVSFHLFWPSNLNKPAS